MAHGHRSLGQAGRQGLVSLAHHAWARSYDLAHLQGARGPHMDLVVLTAWHDGEDDDKDFYDE